MQHSVFNSLRTHDRSSATNLIIFINMPYPVARLACFLIAVCCLIAGCQAGKENIKINVSKSYFMVSGFSSIYRIDCLIQELGARDLIGYRFAYFTRQSAPRGVKKSSDPYLEVNRTFSKN